MRLPDQLRVTLRPSRSAAIALALLASASFGIWLTLPTPPAADLVAAVGLAGWVRHHLRRHATRTAADAIVEVMLSSDALIVVRHRNGRLVAGYVRAGTFVHPWFTSIVWLPDGGRWSRSIPLLPDMLGCDEFRRVRVLLRYGRREVRAGAPASQA